ncbi:MAG: DUF2235 domain-containing protein [Bradyrhizobium sp.]|nr:MAG: DUF2235 domain-containing protein [Bradyrhizobium sp.]
MKRIVVLLDGTWCSESDGDIPTNIARLDAADRSVGAPLIAARDANGVEQRVIYRPGVGAVDEFLKHWLGGAIGFGLRAIIEKAYLELCRAYEDGDALILIGFSRGAYSARALAGMVAASGIVAAPGPAEARIAWNHYRVAPATRAAPLAASGGDRSAIVAHQRLVDSGRVHVSPPIEAVAVFETVGSYGIPAGIGLAALARFWAWWRLGFHDTELGQSVRVGLHAVGVDEWRRPFSPTFWTQLKSSPPRLVEQTWFVGSHGNVGGGDPDRRLANLALVWLAARLQALTGLAFEEEAMAAIGATAGWPGDIVDSTIGWPIDHRWPRLRTMLSPNAFDAGFFYDTEHPERENVNERVHWSVLERAAARALDPRYAPANLPADPPPLRVAPPTPEEARWLGRGG